MWALYLAATSNIGLPFVNQTKTDDNFKIVEEIKNGNPNQSTDEELHILCNGKLNEGLEENVTPP